MSPFSSHPEPIIDVSHRALCSRLAGPSGHSRQPSGNITSAHRLWNKLDARTCAGLLFISTSKVFLQDRDKQKAAIGYLAVVQLDPKYAPGWFNLGVLAEAGQKWIEAKSYFVKCLAVSPHGPESKRAARRSRYWPLM